MGLFDFLFGSKKHQDQVRIERECLTEQERQQKDEQKTLYDRDRLAEIINNEDEHQCTITEENISEEIGVSSERQNGYEIVNIPDTEKYPVIESVSEMLDNMACQVNYAVNIGNENAAIHAMNQLFDSCYSYNGHKLLNVSSENCQPIGLAFANIAIYLDFNDTDLNSVAAENSFYCLARNFIAKGNSFVVPALVTLLLKFPNLLKDKLISSHCDMSERIISMPIAMMLRGNPFKDPFLQGFREQAVSKRIPIMSYIMQYIYDFEKSQYKISTDMPNSFLFLSNKDIAQYKSLVSNYGQSLDDMKKEGQSYFYIMFEACEETLSKC